MPIHFTQASAQRLSATIAGWSFTFGPGTCAAVVRITAATATTGWTFICAGAVASARFRFMIDETNDKILWIPNNASNVASTSTVAHNEWYILAFTKATGTVTGRFHLYRYSTGTWTHENASGTAANATAGATTAFFGGDQAGGNSMDGDIQAVAAWDIAMTDAQVELLVGGIPAWFSQKTPRAMSLFDQDTTSQKFIDITGGGANESARTNAPTIAAVGCPWQPYAIGMVE